MIASKNLLTHALGLGLFLIPIAWWQGLPDGGVSTKWFALYVVTIFVSLLFKFEFPNVLCETKTKALLIFTVLVGMLSFSLHPKSHLEGQILDLICFGVISISSYQVFRNNTSAPKILLCYLLISFLAVIFLSLVVTGFSFPESSFGHRNMAAEYYGLLFLVGVYLLTLRQSRIRFIAISISLISLLWILYTLKSRAVLVSLVVGVFVLQFLPGFRAYKKWVWALGLAFSFLMILLTVRTDLLSGGESWFISAKQANQSLRETRWHNTFNMIWDQPLGVGPGGFEFGYMPYANSWRSDDESHEKLIVRSPHNGYLELASEYGVPFAVLFLILVTLFIVKTWKQRTTPQGSLAILTVSLLLFFMTDAFFAFPMELAFPSFVIAVVIGLGLSILKQSEKVFQIRAIGRFFQYSLPLFLFAMISAFTFSKAVEAKISDSYESLDLACRFFPSNWRVCMEKADFELKKKDYVTAEASFRKILEAIPNHYLALRHLSFILFESGRKQEACKILHHYNELFFGRSSLEGPYRSFCKSNPNP